MGYHYCGSIAVQPLKNYLEDSVFTLFILTVFKFGIRNDGTAPPAFLLRETRVQDENDALPDF